MTEDLEKAMDGQRAIFPLVHSRSQAFPPVLSATVAICTFNGAKRIGYVLESLVEQTQSADQWEIVVVDNVSTDNTVEVCEQWRDQLPVPLRVVRETRPGLSYARGCAARSARGKIICFLDDDTPATPAWVEQAVQAFIERPRAGCLGGKVSPIWESEPTQLVLEVCTFALAICDRGEEPFEFFTAAGGGPVGAGICLQRSVMLEAYQNDRWAARNLGPVGTKRISGSEMALNAVIAGLGYEIWYIPELVIYHIIPAQRMTFEYLAQLYESIGRGQALTRRLYDWKARNLILGTLIGVKDLARWLHGSFLRQRDISANKKLDLQTQINILHQRQLWGRGWQAIRESIRCRQVFGLQSVRSCRREL